MVLVGTKSDLAEERKIPSAQLDTFAQAYDLVYIETSAKTGDGVSSMSELFHNP